MSPRNAHVRHGFGAVRPYVHGGMELFDLVRAAFGAEEIERHEFGPDSVHLEVKIGDSVIVLELGELPPDVTPWTNSTYIYVEDVDAAYARALNAGAVSVSAPEDKPYAERAAGVRDRSGNTWWLATYRA